MTQPVALDDFYDLTIPLELAVSPDGDRVAFVAREANLDDDSFQTSLFVVPTDGSEKPHRLTRASEASSPAWSPNGTKLGFIANREADLALTEGAPEDEEDGPDEEDSRTGLDSPAQLWLFDLARGGDARQLTEFDEGVREFDWSPNGEQIVVSARDPTDEETRELRNRREENSPIEVERFQHKLDGQGYLDTVTTYLFVVNIDTREQRRLDDAFGEGAVAPQAGLQPAWGSESIAFCSYRGENPDQSYALDVYLADPAGGSAECLTDGDLTAFPLQWSPDGSHLAFAAGDSDNAYDPAEVFVAEPETKRYWSVSESLDRTLAFGAGWIDEDTLVAAIGDKGRTRLVQLHADEDAPERIFESQYTNRTIQHFDLAGGVASFTLSSSKGGTDIYAAPVEELANENTEALVRLSALNDELLSEAGLPQCERIHFENSDDDEIEGFVYLPSDFGPEESDARPLITDIHGGPTTYDAPRFEFDYAYWTGHGYIVLNINYRGSTSYGRSFSEAIRGEWGPRESDDILSGIEHVVERGWVDAEQLFLTGFSQGGINTVHILTRSDSFAAAAPEHGIYDFFSLYGTGDRHIWYENDLGLPWEDPERYRAISSLQDVDEIDTPVLITAGENDQRCPPSQAEQLYASLKRRGVPTKLIVYPDEHHDISRPKRATHRLEAVTDWFEKHDPTKKS